MRWFDVVVRRDNILVIESVTIYYPGLQLVNISGFILCAANKLPNAKLVCSKF
jgi:hypothetical protein